MRVIDRFTMVRSRLLLSGRSMRFRLTVLYGGLFLVAGIGLLAITYVLVDHSTTTALFVKQERRARRGERWAARLVDAQSATQDRHSLARTAAGRPPARRASDRPAHPRPPPTRHAVRHRARCHGGAGCRSRLARGGAGTPPITDDGGRYPTDHRTEPARKACPLRTE